MIYKISRTGTNMNNGNPVEPRERTAYLRRSSRSECTDVLLLTRFPVMVLVYCRGRKRDSASDSNVTAMPCFVNQTENDFLDPQTQAGISVTSHDLLREEQSHRLSFRLLYAKQCFA
ncbi:hypothetical protein GQ55_3G271500 [Panicum hallii var. hallii]|uniref:Uncharacterized protein n=1 Tax=Panicum hallii var. hallii TaxID=1504633 RepID=A0A2T7EDV0_9POAL|nr:hypothetical protein GQ55_3G271500 [Panicum hallii var. hallii]